MPTYVYKFVDTGETIEVQQSFSEPTLTEAVHPVTGDVKTVKKVFLPVGVTFKGSGFYKTDSRSGGAKGASKLPATNGEGSGSASSGESSSSSSGTNGSGSANGSASSGSSGSTGSTGSSTGSGDHGHSHSHTHTH